MSMSKLSEIHNPFINNSQLSPAIINFRVIIIFFNIFILPAYFLQELVERPGFYVCGGFDFFLLSKPAAMPNLKSPENNHEEDRVDPVQSSLNRVVSAVSVDAKGDSCLG